MNGSIASGFLLLIFTCVKLTDIMTTEYTTSTPTVTITKKERSSVEITGELPFSELEKHRAAAVAHVSEHINLDGFRKGHVPEAVIIKNVGEMAILEEMARMAISEAYPTIVITNKIDVIGHPEISITKIAAESPLGFSITTAVVPTLDLPDYKKLAKKANETKETVSVTDEEVEHTIAEVLKHRGTDDHVHGETCDHDHDHGDDATKDTEEKSIELTDDIARSLGDFKDATDLRAKVKENMIAEKEHRAKQAHRGAIMDAIISEIKAEMPDVIVENEIDRMMAQFEGDISRMGLKFDAYLEHIKKTRDDLRNEWRPDGIKSAKTQFALTEIGRLENITPDKDRVASEAKALLEQHPGTPEESVLGYVEMVLTNDAVLAFLEEQK
ncbi:MAG: hypothetical protein HGA67_01650 [Candidatus Yonathbacteria bacterium]|nr:hypothetical protein [Candidatus Yonathbacteria bacterium]